jgi:mannose-1-phosphate guanylyltransferase
VLKTGLFEHALLDICYAWRRTKALKILILSGGSGGREWPSSDMPKPYLPVLDGPGGKPESMLGRLWRQLMTADLLENTSIVSCSEHVGELKQQLGANAPILIEPSPRGSYSATMLAVAHLYTIAGVTPNETIIVLPADFYVEGDFYHCVRSLPKLLRESESSIMMVGAKAEQPSSRYGYIILEQLDGKDEEFEG